MSRDENRLHLAVQKSGRLSDQSRQLLKDAGLKLLQGGRNELAARAENFPLDLMLVRDDDIPTFVADGVCELGIVGQNVLEEYALGLPEPRIEQVAKLGFGRCSLKIAAPDSLRGFELPMLGGKRIATSYPRLLRRFLETNGLDAEVVAMRGAVELAPRLGIAGFVCDLVSTGATLDANGLAPVADVFDSEAVLVRTMRPIDAAHAEQAQALLTRIDGVIATAESKYIVLNAPEGALPAITHILPGAEAPTVVPLIGRPGHVAVQAVCQESVFWETLERLKAAGASAILVMPIEKMML
ncbi:MAG: ATP phosphoribosyltransferase _ HisGl [uncultured Sphingomonas sp.]|uniref:ATP phosphoribosyltransferase n=1 Tax=uncultured Sphingomonas sp. TaxID=158754 RepID=A0A6J4SLX6_9SPHN|nr:ATP phosphoribosyltransferase [uncultured Sphingomonas sp.]CAA9499674.1 MAG: ATP phosphoribosyltransferase > HisGl [uncultured Sphingomonas sp.]